MDRADIEILRALKKDSKFHTIPEIKQLGDNLPEDSQFSEKLRILQRNQFVEKQILANWPRYIITQNGIDLIWKGDVGLQIIRLLYNIGKCSNDDLEHFLVFRHDEIQKEIEDLRNNRNLIRRKDELDDKKFWVLTDDRGKDFARNLCEGLDIMKGADEAKQKALIESTINSISNITPKEKEHHWWKETKYWIPIGVTIVLSIIGWLLIGG